jgi:hypothetical protein
MDKTQAIKHIESLFDHAFSEDKFILFCTNFFNDFNKSKATPVQSGPYVYQPYQNHIKSFKRIGQYTDPNGEILDVLSVKVQAGYKLERTRTGFRNFAIEYLKRKDDRDTLLIAFHSDDSPDWRFSFVKLEYKTSKDEKGRIKARQEATSARRYSFLVGENEPCHTAKKQLLPLLIENNNNPTLTDIEHCFTIEKVTKEFFEQYKTLFVDLQEQLEIVIKKDKKIAADFTVKNIDSSSFAKKLLGQIVFLYFIQKKGWLGVDKNNSFGQGKKCFLKTLFKQAEDASANYYNDYLEYLFYEALAAQRNTTDPSYYKRFNCRIPFLNGGLFEPIKDYDWQNTEINLPNELFSNTKPTKENDIGTGILDVFDRYNFTVKEDEPLEKEVAVDPEMLGKVFENLLEVKDRKSKGAYYTPREIVHYMCQESLINYLDTALNSDTASFQELAKDQTDLLGNKGRNQTTLEFENKDIKVPKDDMDAFIKNSHLVVEDNRKEDNSFTWKLPASIQRHAKLFDKALAEIKVCDPAIGSGAFPVGMLNEIVKARTALTPYMKLKSNDEGRTQYHLKRECIQNSLYGVDIDESAIDIAKLRLWLSLVVDEESIQDIEPLPNLDYKIVCGNSLLGIEIDAFNVAYFEELEEKKGVYFSTTDPKGKRKLHQEIEELIYKITDGKKIFDFEVYFSEIWHRPSEEVNVVNAQIAALNKQIDAINVALKLDVEHEIVKLKFVAAQQQISIVEIEIKKIEKNIANIFGEIAHVEKNIVMEERAFIYEIKSLNFSIELLNKKIGQMNDLMKANTGRGGFDVVIGNPPYGASYSSSNKKYFLKKYVSSQTISGIQKGSLDTYALFIEQGYNCIAKNGSLCFIIPISITSSDSMTALHTLLENNCETIKISSYAVRPQPVFANAVVNTSILFFVKTGTKCQNLLATRMYRKKNDLNLQKLVNNLEFTNVLDVKIRGRYPKISYDIEHIILTKIFKQERTIGELITTAGSNIYYRTTGGRYFKVITNYPTGSTQEKAITVEKKSANCVGAILSSNLFFWFYQVYSDNLHIKAFEIESFKVPNHCFSNEIITAIEKIYSEYLEDIEKNANIRQTTRYANIDSFKEYKIGKSKSIIDRIDDLICPLYGLTEQEIKFIKNYEIEFRLGDEIDD